MVVSSPSRDLVQSWSDSADIAQHVLGTRSRAAVRARPGELALDQLVVEIQEGERLELVAPSLLEQHVQGGLADRSTAEPRHHRVVRGRLPGERGAYVLSLIHISE